MICRRCQTANKRRAARNKAAAEPLMAAVSGGETAAVADVAVDSRGTQQDECEVAEECGHFSPIGHSRFCPDCSVGRWCCGACGRPLTETDILPA